MRILLVEDDAMLADAVSRAFTQSAHAVDLVNSGEAADEALVSSTYDLVLLDIALPDVRGPADDGVLRSRMGVAAASLMREHSWDHVAKQTLDVYYHHLARRHAGQLAVS